MVISKGSKSSKRFFIFYSINLWVSSPGVNKMKSSLIVYFKETSEEYGNGVTIDVDKLKSVMTNLDEILSAREKEGTRKRRRNNDGF